MDRTQKIEDRVCSLVASLATNHSLNGDGRRYGPTLTALAEAISDQTSHYRDQLNALKHDYKNDAALYESQVEALSKERDEWKAKAESHSCGLTTFAELRAERDQYIAENSRLEQRVVNLLANVTAREEALQAAGDRARRLAVELRELKDPGLESELERLRRVIRDWQMEEECMPGAARPAHVDPGSAEGDRSVISWRCDCKTLHTFEPPKFGSWFHKVECVKCGAKTTITKPHN